MRCAICCSLGLLAALLPWVQGAPVPKHKDAAPAIIDAGSDANIAGIIEDLVDWARVAVRENEKVAGLDIIRRQKDWQLWLKKNLQFDRIKGTNRVQIRFRDGTPQEQAAIINTVVDYCLKKIVGKRRESLESGLKNLRFSLEDPRTRRRLTEKQLAEAENRMKEWQERLQKLPKLTEPAKAR